MILIDLGTSTVRAGIAGSQIPDVVTNNILYYDHLSSRLHTIKSCNKASCEIISVMEYGHIVSRELFAVKMGEIFEEMEIKDKAEIIISMHTSNTNDRSIIMDVLFTQHGFNKIAITDQAPFVLAAHNRSSGCVIDIGEGVTSVCCVYNNSIIPKTLKSSTIAGYRITDYHNNIDLSRTGTNVLERRKLKELKCKVSPLPLSQHKNNNPCCRAIDMTLTASAKNLIPHAPNDPDSYEAFEIIFNPSRAGYMDHGICELVFCSLNEFDLLRTNNLITIAITGSTTQQRGFLPRIISDLGHIMTDLTEVKKIRFSCKVDRDLDVYQGMNILSRTTLLDNAFVHKAQYLKYIK